jgi:hypothetical protein
LLNGKCDTCIVGKTLSSQCIKCAPGYVPSKIDLSKCFPEILKCQSYSRNDTCSTCNDGLFLVNGKCDTNNCDTNNNFVFQNNRCVCKSGFRVSDLDPKKCSPIFANCTTYEKDICVNCSAGNRLSTDKPPKCVSGVENCQSYTNFNLCIKCTPNYCLEINNCFLIPKIANCLNYHNSVINIFEGRTNNQYCQSCESGYHPSLDKKSCIVNIPNCN